VLDAGLRNTNKLDFATAGTAPRISAVTLNILHIANCTNAPSAAVGRAEQNKQLFLLCTYECHEHSIVQHLQHMLHHAVVQTIRDCVANSYFAPITFNPRHRCEQQSMAKRAAIEVQTQQIQCRSLRAVHGECVSWNERKLPTVHCEW